MKRRAVVLSWYLFALCHVTSALHIAPRQVPPVRQLSVQRAALDTACLTTPVCPPPPRAGDNAVVQEVRADSYVLYSCKDNYVRIDGQEQLKCVNGAWSGKPLQCGAVCRDYGNIRNGFRNLNGTLQGSVVTFGCLTGFTLIGNKALTCGRNGFWIGAWPECLMCTVDCGDPGNTPGARRLLLGTTQGSVVSYSCPPGNMLTGNRTRKCLPTGVWSGTTPTCKATGCAPLMPRMNSFIATVTSDDCNVAYGCNSGFLLVGSSVSVYTEMGWSSPPPTCIHFIEVISPPFLDNCGLPPALQFGTVDLPNGTTLGSFAVYRCTQGYTSCGPSAGVVCQLSGWSGNPTTCLANISCPTPILIDGTVTFTSTSTCSVVRYQCKDGFILVGPGSQTCISGKWTDSSSNSSSSSSSSPVCKEPANGKINITCNTVGCMASYSCNNQSVLIGNSTTVCLSNGLWSGSSPVCQAITCPAFLTEPANGKITIPCNTVGCIATYSCNNQSVLIGNSTRVCLSNGLWSGSSSACQAITCPASLTEPANGKITIPCKTVGCIATYSCNNQSVLIGNSTRVCQITGLWNGSSPICQVTVSPFCSETLLTPSNGSINVPCNTTGCVATYSCNNQSALIGMSTRVCQPNGLWSGSSPVCQAISCNETLTSPDNGMVNVPCIGIGCVATYTCNNRSLLIGNAARACQANGLWSGSSPVCQVIICNEVLLPPGNGNLKVPCNATGCVATYSCNNQSVLIGNSTRVCQITGLWSGSSPMCQVTVSPFCSETLLTPSNGSINVPCNTTGCVATYSCNNQSVLIGMSTRVCQPNGLWSGSSPVCQAISCNETLTSPDNGMVNVPCIGIGCVATYTCNNRSLLIGNAARACQANGLWSGSSPVCQVIICNEVLLPPGNGNLKVPCNTTGCVATYSCNNQSVLIGNSTRVCQITGLWSGSSPMCQVTVSPFCSETLLTPSNGTINVPCNTTGCVATYSCNNQSVLIGMSTRVCQPNGLWSGSSPVCQAISCNETLTSPDNGMVNVPCIGIGCVATYTCNNGSLLIGNAARACQANGLWSGSSPVCQGPLQYYWVRGHIFLQQPECSHWKFNKGVSSHWSVEWIQSYMPSYSFETLLTPSNGSINVPCNTTGCVATYSCNNQSVLIGMSTRVCQPNGLWSGSSPVCQAISCNETLTSPDNGMVNVPCIGIGCVATYTCNNGSLLVGNAARACQANGLWSGPSPVCQGPLQCYWVRGHLLLQQPECSHWEFNKGVSNHWSVEWIQSYVPSYSFETLLTPSNGSINVPCNTTGCVATYSCNNQSVLIGMSTRVCQPNGLWSGSSPVCQAISCNETLTSPDNGMVNVPCIGIGCVATYTCNNGSLLIGNAARACQANGLWSGSSPVCQVITCNEVLLPPGNGNLKVPCNTTGCVATYSCNNQSVLIGNSTRVCQVTGLWSGSSPMCQVTVSPFCSETLLTPSNGSINVPCNTTGCVATYSCNNQSALIGDTSRVCQPNGLWSGSSPVCQAISCNETLTSPDNGMVNVPCVGIGCVATYTCNNGSLLVGNAARACQANGLWSGSSPVCQGPLQCYWVRGHIFLQQPECSHWEFNKGVSSHWSVEWIQSYMPSYSFETLLTPSNGSINVPCNTTGCVATYSCNNQSALIGMSTRVCQPNGLWSGSSPVCQAISCNETLTSPDNGMVNVPCIGIGCVATYTCNNGSLLIGNAARACQVNGLWSGSSPVCQVIICNEVLPPPRNGNLKVPCNATGCVATYSCNNQSVLIGDMSRVCQTNGLWSGSSPVCQAISCNETLTSPDNGMVNVPCVGIGCVATYTCNNRSLLIGNAARACQVNGLWSGFSPVCQVITCPRDATTSPLNGQVILSGNNLGDTATYSCATGFVLSGGNSIRTCAVTGVWSGVQPTCQALCPSLTTPNDGVLVISNGRQPGSQATFSCNFRFKLVGTATRICQNGVWSGSDTTCQPITCPDLTLVPLPNGMVLATGRLLNNVVTYKCNSSFTFEGTLLRTCISTEIWTGTDPFCIPIGAIRCPPLASPANGSVLFEPRLVGTTASYSCNQGNLLEGIPQRVCQQNGTWSGDQPFCLFIDCGPLAAPTGGSVSFLSTTLGAVATYSCSTGFILGGLTSRQCGRERNMDQEHHQHAHVLVDCGQPPSILNGVVAAAATTFSATASYTCSDGYKLRDVAITVCTETGSWSTPTPVCDATGSVVDCGILPSPSMGSIQLTATSVGSVVTYQCQSGFMLTTASATRTCLPTGKWSDPTPSCVPVMCPALPNPGNGAVRLTGTEVGNQALYSCAAKFTLVGQLTRTSTSCPDPGAPNNGHRIGTSPDFLKGSSVLFVCMDGFVISGTQVQLCQADATWSGVVPSCIEAQSTCTSIPGTTIDQYGRLCDCISTQGNLGGCPRYRAVWNALTDAQRERYIKAVKESASSPTYAPFYNSLVAGYKSYLASALTNTQVASQLLVVNRYFMLQYEDILRASEPGVTIPVWDWTVTPNTPYATLVFDPAMGFGNAIETPGTESCVSNGPFQRGMFSVTPSADTQPCVRRQMSTSTRNNPTLSTVNDVLALPASGAQTFRSRLSSFNADITCTVGGQMCNSDAANDPLYLLNQAKLDSILTQWQLSSPANAAALFVGDSTPLALGFDSLKVSDLSSNSKLPYGVSVTYNI
eukprot:Em0021g746a